jgi:hypothetical protein
VESRDLASVQRRISRNATATPTPQPNARSFDSRNGLASESVPSAQDDRTSHKQRGHPEEAQTLATRGPADEGIHATYPLSHSRKRAQHQCPKSNRAGRTLLSAAVAVASIFQTTPLICHPERSVIVQRKLTRSRGTLRPPAPATNWQGVLSARCGCGQQLSPNPIAQGEHSCPPPSRLLWIFQAIPKSVIPSAA